VHLTDATQSSRTDAATQAFSTGTLAGAGSFRCDRCGFAVALHELDEIPVCPHCGGGRYKRASIFGDQGEAEPWGALEVERPDWLDDVREALVEEGAYLAWRTSERTHVVPLQEGWTRVGRSLAAHIRFDDPTVSRRHALVHLEENRVRLLDDRSLNGVFVNGRHVEWQELADGDELLIGRFRIYFLSLGHTPAGLAGGGVGSTVA
jgi:hypothetical protein